MKQITLANKSTFALVDDSDFECVNQWKWHLDITGYAVRKPKSGKIYMHRLLLNVGAKQVDHINGNTLDNRRSNLRPSTIAENRRNKGPKSENTSGYKGVTKRKNKWIAQISANGTGYYLGIFDNKESAAKAYNKAATQLHGEFAKLNKIRGS